MPLEIEEVLPAVRELREPEVTVSLAVLEAKHHLVVVCCQASTARTWVVCRLCSCMQNKSTPAGVHMNTIRKTSNDSFAWLEVIDWNDAFVYRA